MTLFWFNTMYQELLVEKLAHMTCELSRGRDGGEEKYLFQSQE